ncbi:hypothetical protein JNUCC1_02808 [Lentibacillus sp. JNUCC-1]|uniref:hypothetical protein n=1 Tax=Lentibacillus sp. JNUCC-1 TaxID=2654513 RepID=UPI0012E987EE|nr:hypothetical protein [Lentibacillus sp. JNUCC-1]MUV38936.1 hypothetical protein [Lentibacillus sp. JNUCC-1]
MAKEKDGSIKLNSHSFLSKVLAYLFMSALIFLIAQVAIKIYVGSFELKLVLSMMDTYVLTVLLVLSGTLFLIVRKKRKA